MLKKKVYFKVTDIGMRVLRTIFPEYFADDSLPPSDRYVEYAFVVKNLPPLPAKVLDVGCSGSLFPLLLASFGYDTYGIDIRNYPILKRLDFDNFKFIKDDIRNSSLPDAYFDTITAISTIEHIGIQGRYGMDDDIESDIKAIKEMKRILKPRGRIIITIPFGKFRVIKPYTRIYDDVRVLKVVGDFEIEKEEYYMQDDFDNWFRCLKNDALLVDAKADRYPLCMLRIKKRG